MREKKLVIFIYIFLGLVLGLALAFFDRWLDVHHHSVLFSWSTITLIFMISGGIIGHLLEEVFMALRKKDEAILEQKKFVQEISRFQSEMSRLERFNLVGQLAAGLVHEIRNPITTVRGYLQLLGEKSEFRSYGSIFEVMVEELDRTNSIISEFLSLVKDRHAQMQNQNINDILQNLFPLLEADALSQNKRLVFESMDTPKIPLNAQEIAQLVLNLCRNGLEAMQEKGTLMIRTYIESGQVVLTVQDEGIGIPLELLDKLGTPFFTTKENGTGLGIVTCYRIAEKHQAKIDLESDSNGTKFFVRFPYLAVNDPVIEYSF